MRVFCLVLTVASIALADPISNCMLAEVLAMADTEGIPRSIALGLMIEESGNWRTGALGDPLAVGPETDGYASLGLYQLHSRWLPGFLRDYWHQDDFDVFNPFHNATVAFRYLAALYSQYKSWRSALYFYNCGRTENVPESTFLYTDRILKTPPSAKEDQTNSGVHVK